ncbi:MAG: N-acetyl-alpha-D-glucosaminyl L-malate synthase BshA [Sphingobacteriaceae bacterium]|nr:N-acetyl-alpha-D-glucosaminyl L-malate synthase BshA [Sphingobacteriaceae bacterium]
MNIGMICFPTYGGSGVVASELGIALAKKGHKVHFMSYTQPFRLNIFNQNLFYHEFSVNDYPLFDYQPYESVLASKIVDVAIFEKLDVLHVHYAIPHASVAYMAQQILLSKNIKLPYLTTLHGTDITLVGRDPAFEPIICFSLNHSNAISAVSESLKRETREIFHIDKPIEVVPNFINVNEFSNTVDMDLKKSYAPDGEKIIVHVSNFRKVKRVDDVLKVFDQIRKKIPAKLILVGDGPERPNIEALCRHLNTCNDIISLGKINNPKQVLSIADLFVLPSETESFGLAALEAMASGVPVISTNTGGLSEVNIHNQTGYLCDVGDVTAMANFAIQLLSNDDLLSKFRMNALKRASEFDVNNILPMYEKIYANLVKKGI